jgi:hypothetical protein
MRQITYVKRYSKTMRHADELFRRQASTVIGAIVLRAVEDRRYEITHNRGQPQMEIYPAWGMGLSWSVSVKSYPSDPFMAELIRLHNLFQSFALQWRTERNPLSSNAWDNVLNPAYQRIIGMGTDAVRFILQELRRELGTGEPDDWFMALWAITGENPVPTEHRGKIKEMAQAWLEWGSRQGYLDGEELGVGIPAFGQVGRA